MRSKDTRSNSADAQLNDKTQRTLEAPNVQKTAGKLTPDVDEQFRDSNNGSADKTAGQSNSFMQTCLPTFKGDVTEHYHHASPDSVEREYRAEEKCETRSMDNKGRTTFQPRVMRSEFQTRMSEDSRKQLEEFASETGSDDKRREKSFANRICSVKVTDKIGMPVPGNRYGLDDTWVHFSSVSEFPINARNLTLDQYVQIDNLQAIARVALH